MRVSYFVAMAVLACGCGSNAPKTVSNTESTPPAPTERTAPAPVEETPSGTAGKVAEAPPPKPLHSEATQQKAAETNANPDALVLQDFNQRIDAYVKLHNDAAKAAAKDDAPKLKETDQAGHITAAEHALAAKIGVMRANAKAGDIFTPEIRNKFRRLMYPEVKGREGGEVKEELKEDAPTGIPLKANAPYPDGKPFPTVPPNLLLNLPTLPKELDYRIIDKHLILRDVGANMIVDFIPNAIR